MFTNESSICHSKNESTENQINKPVISLHNCLPEIELPLFSGKINEWRNFWETFSLIHNDNNLAIIEKFYYLKKCLSGEAFEIVDNFSFSSQNYNFAINLLFENFDNPEKLKDELINEIESLESPEHNPKSLVRFRNKFNVIRRKLSHFWSGVQLEIYLKVILQKKLPCETKLELYRYFKSCEISVNDYIIGLKFVIDILEACLAPCTSPQKIKSNEMIKSRPSKRKLNVRQKSNKYEKKLKNISVKSNRPDSVIMQNRTERNKIDKRHLSERRTLKVKQYEHKFHEANKQYDSRQMRKRKTKLPNTHRVAVVKLKCVFCGNLHNSSYCSVYSDYSSRINRLAKLKRCSNCLSKRHRTEHCKYSYTCTYCQRKSHHRSVCKTFNFMSC